MQVRRQCDGRAQPRQDDGHRLYLSRGPRARHRRPGKNGLRLFKREDLFISLHNVVKIGADVVLVDLKNARPDGGKRDECPPGGRRYDVG